MYLEAFLDNLGEMWPKKFSRGLDPQLLAWTGAEIFGVPVKKITFGGGGGFPPPPVSMYGCTGCLQMRWVVGLSKFGSLRALFFGSFLPIANFLKYFATQVPLPPIWYPCRCLLKLSTTFRVWGLPKMLLQEK